MTAYGASTVSSAAGAARSAGRWALGTKARNPLLYAAYRAALALKG